MNPFHFQLRLVETGQCLHTQPPCELRIPAPGPQAPAPRSVASPALLALIPRRVPARTHRAQTADLALCSGPPTMSP